MLVVQEKENTNWAQIIKFSAHQLFMWNGESKSSIYFIDAHTIVNIK